MWTASIAGRRGDFALDVELAGGPGPTALVGPNGSGKTTLLRFLAGGLRPARGRLEVGGRTLFDSAASIDVPPEGRSIGYVPQGYGLFPHLTALDNVAFGLREHARERAHAALDALGCAHVAHLRPAALSGGERQRVALARALAPGPSLLLLDEPLAALDAGTRRQVRGFLRERLASLGCPSLVVTHDPRDVAALDAPVRVLEAGRVVQAGSLAELRAAPATPFVAELLDSAHPER
ncbi:MAG: ATP-binding cassette domain-containing protein [Alphaproteobacteria bacterium]|nr:ATP-binding cassette domain-containing protein [Alphaproteobacteria bacterium]